MPNTAQTSDFSTVQDNLDLADALSVFKGSLARAQVDGSLGDGADSILKEITWAIKEAIMPAPSKAALQDHLENARDLLPQTDLGSLFTTQLHQAAEAVRRIA